MKVAIIVCGDRNYKDEENIRQVLKKYIKFDEVHIIEGECPCGGADILARNIAEELKYIVHKFPANFSKGKSAGPIRNKAMLNFLLSFGKEYMKRVISFHPNIENSKGTKDMMKISEKSIEKGESIKCKYYT